MVKRNLIFVFLILVVLLFGMNDAMANATDDYFDAHNGGKSVVNSSKVNVDKVIPSKYTFPLGWFDSSDNNKSKVYYENTSPLDKTERNSWADNAEYDIIIEYGNKVRKANNALKGNFRARYYNVGGKQIDVVLTIEDFHTLNSNSRTPFILFYEKKMGIEVGNVNWVKVRYDFYEAGTDNQISVNGYTTYWDVDAYQGIHFVTNNSLYATKTSKLYISELNDKSYVFSKITNGHDWTSLDERGAITETFSGKSMTRVFTFSNKGDSGNSIARAQGGIWNSPIVSTAFKNYYSNSSGEGGIGVAKRSKMIYSVQFTNGNPNKKATVTVVDELGEGLKYANEATIEPTSCTYNSQTKKWTLTWSGISLNPTTSKTINYKVEVEKDATDENPIFEVENKANVTIRITGEDPRTYITSLKNAVLTKNYFDNSKITGYVDGVYCDNGTTNKCYNYESRIVPADATNSNVKVSLNDKIVYTVDLHNPTNNSQSIKVIDTLTNLKYINGSAKLVCKSNDGSRLKEDDGAKGTWKVTLDSGASCKLIYATKVSVLGKNILNSGSVYYDTTRVDLEGLKKDIADTTVNPQNTASVITVFGIAIGLALTGIGTYFIYRKCKKATD